MRAFVMLVLAAAAIPALAQTTSTEPPQMRPPLAERPIKGPPLPGTEAPRPQRSTTTLVAEPEGATASTLKTVDTAADGTQPRQRMVTVFGTEDCPKPTSADEIVVCVRLPESEIYRIPPKLRQAERRVSPFESNRNLLLGDASGGAGGSIGSCSAIGSGGMIGCNRRQVDAWAADRTNRMGVEEEVPPQ